MNQVVTPAQIRARHEAALASLTPEQKQALARLETANTLALHTVATREMRLEAVFVSEAADLNEQLADWSAGGDS